MLSGIQESVGSLVVDVRAAAAGSLLHGVGGEIVGGHTGDASDQLVRLVDDHRVVLGQDVPALEGIDGKQGVVGDDHV